MIRQSHDSSKKVCLCEVEADDLAEVLGEHFGQSNWPFAAKMGRFGG
jgi:hypothetical protein